jgi:hypothetical protein
VLAATGWWGPSSYRGTFYYRYRNWRYHLVRCYGDVLINGHTGAAVRPHERCG